MRVLVVEDERDLNRLIVKMLKKAGYSVDGCYDGEEAEDYLRGADYDAILLDVMMPKLDGYRLLERLRLGHFAVNAAQGAVHAEQHHNKFIAEPCSNISDDKQQDRQEKVEKQQNNAVNSQRSDRHAVQDFQQTLGVCVPEIEKIMQLGCRAVVVIRLADKQRVQRDAARKNQ